jgi:hypothetical protein
MISIHHSLEKESHSPKKRGFMSFFKESVPVAIPILISLGFTFGVHSYSKADTTQRLEQVALKKTQQEEAQAQRQAAFNGGLSANVKAADTRDAKITAQENAKKKEAEKVAVVAALPGAPPPRARETT